MTVRNTLIASLFDYIQNDIVPDKKKEALRVKYKATKFAIIDGKLFRRSYFGPYLTYTEPNKVPYVLMELHKGECGNHLGVQSLAHKALTIKCY